MNVTRQATKLLRIEFTGSELEARNREGKEMATFNKGNFNYEIIEKIAVISEKEYSDSVYTVELNLISYNGSEPKYDLRKWHDEKMQKGIALDREELAQLKEALNAMEV